MSSHAGETLADYLDEKNITQAEFAKKIKRPLKTVNEIIKGKCRITTETAFQLQRYTKISAEFWLIRQMNYEINQFKKGQRGIK